MSGRNREWTVVRDRNDYHGMVEVVGPGVGGHLVIGFTVATDVDAEEARRIVDDANLIASAPDLLAACRLSLVRFETDGWPLNPESNKAIELLRAALAKAGAT